MLEVLLQHGHDTGQLGSGAWDYCILRDVLGGAGLMGTVDAGFPPLARQACLLTDGYHANASC